MEWRALIRADLQGKLDVGGVLEFEHFHCFRVDTSIWVIDLEEVGGGGRRKRRGEEGEEGGGRRERRGGVG